MAGIFKGVGNIVGSLLGMETAVPTAPPPVVTPPTAMPGLNDAQVKAAKKKVLTDQQQRQGRLSTIMTDATDEKLGG